MIIFTESTIVDLKAGTIKGKIHKSFDQIGDFNSWYKIAKMDSSMVINIMHYNPLEKPTFKQVNDVRLLQVSRELAV